MDVCIIQVVGSEKVPKYLKRPEATSMAKLSSSAFWTWRLIRRDWTEPNRKLKLRLTLVLALEKLGVRRKLRPGNCQLDIQDEAIFSAHLYLFLYIPKILAEHDQHKEGAWKCTDRVCHITSHFPQRITYKGAFAKKYVTLQTRDLLIWYRRWIWQLKKVYHFKDGSKILIRTEEEYIKSSTTQYTASTLQACKSVDDCGISSSRLGHEGWYFCVPYTCSGLALLIPCQEVFFKRHKKALRMPWLGINVSSRNDWSMLEDRTRCGQRVILAR